MLENLPNTGWVERDIVLPMLAPACSCHQASCCREEDSCKPWHHLLTLEEAGSLQQCFYFTLLSHSGAIFTTKSLLFTSVHHHTFVGMPSPIKYLIFFCLIASCAPAQLATNPLEKEVCLYACSALTGESTVKQYHIEQIVGIKYIFHKQ